MWSSLGHTQALGERRTHAAFLPGRAAPDTALQPEAGIKARHCDMGGGCLMGFCIISPNTALKKIFFYLLREKIRGKRKGGRERGKKREERTSFSKSFSVFLNKHQGLKITVQEPSCSRGRLPGVPQAVKVKPSFSEPAAHCKDWGWGNLGHYLSQRPGSCPYLRCTPTLV